MKLRYEGYGLTVTNEGQDWFTLQFENASGTWYLNSRQLSEMLSAVGAMVDFQKARRYLEVVDDDER